MSILDQYHYELPPELVARRPAAPRDSARLLVYDTAQDQISCATFRDLPGLLPARSLLVLNDTKVVPARLRATSQRGDDIELFLLVDQGMHNGNCVRGLVSRYVEVGEILRVEEAVFVVRDNREKWMELEVSLSFEQILELLQRYGMTPIPPYIKDSPLEESALRTEYQSVFAITEASVAAPTASLHFTHDLLRQLEKAQHDTARVTLHVGLGTFAPVLPENIVEQKLHIERYAVSDRAAAVIRDARDAGRSIVAVGTTVVRTLESAVAPLAKGVAAAGQTELFITPPYQFTFPDALITNFHVPRSSLMCMVDAFLQHKRAPRSILNLYEYAITEKFRFYSFGDGMLIR